MMFPKALLLVLAPALFVGCTESAHTVRRATYPASFEYLDKATLGQGMSRLALDIRQLDRALRARNAAPVDAALVVQTLMDIEATAAGLSGTGHTNHPEFDVNIAAFRTDAGAARAAAQTSPPSYFLAGALVGSCKY